MDLVLPVKRKWFEQIQSGEKLLEYRLNNDYWKKRLIGKSFDRVVITLGYPKSDDSDRRIIRQWLGYEMKIVVSEEWGYEPQDCFSIFLHGFLK